MNEQIDYVIDIINQLYKVNNDNDEKLQKLKEKISLLVGRLVNNRDDMRIGATISEIFALIDSMKYDCMIAERSCSITFLKQIKDKLNEVPN